MSDSSGLHVVTTHSNPLRYKSRDQLLDRWLKRMADARVESVVVVEVAYDDTPSRMEYLADRVREHRMERWHENLNFVVRRTRAGMWQKERAINLGFGALPREWKFAAWIDADVDFTNPNWDDDTVAALRLHDVVQPWSHAQDLGPVSEPVGPMAQSFMYSYVTKQPAPNGRYGGKFWHPGFAWAIRRDAYEAAGGLLDTAILGAGDHHMALALIGKAERSIPGGMTQGYKDSVLGWQDLAETHIKRNVGYVPGLITHGWHGNKRDRRYVERWDTLIKYQYNPARDIRRDGEGLWDWAHTNDERMRGLRDSIWAYMKARSEDSIDVV